ncbi:trypsin-like serine protease [Massilia yuzhufengensis]|uniref:PEP-CTERM protein-sorting domain-containing protein/MYXO-CTERM domain-containing protein n=1 Tax=Massilia yuzhufengensis TaxID=1164594 RepID=A0A1I1HER3_9BURK|nr:trypsin-like serine protease [Massilia yuzhufengensis]SFC19973.1 PEP-CTERM protein-sorting domain-containing protein/MYXO-CTERM domain-containing protein [Massilia yuzhufengensis]
MVGAVQQSFLCSGALVGKRQVVSADHCVDTNGNGAYVDLTKPGNDVRVVFNSDGNVNALINASSFAVHSDYKGFNVCPNGSSGCVNDDVAVLTLAQDAPASAQIYKVAVNPLLSGTHIIMAGYGTTGNGVTGYAANSSSFVTKRTGENYADLFDGDDEQNFAGNAEVFYADFDGAGRDTFCTRYGVCSPILPNNRESGIGAGDSGGPSFVEMYGELMLVANNTFSGRFTGQVAGTFGTYFGGMIMGAYTDFLQQATGGRIAFVPEPGSIALLGLGGLFVLGSRRRRSAK